MNRVRNLFVGEEGQGMTEYGLVLGAIAIGVVGVLVLLRTQIKTLIESVTTGLGNSTTDVTTP